MSNSKNITHKELITFTNLTNLEWEFVQLELESNDESEMQLDTAEPRYHKLKDLLTPEVFVRRNVDGEIEKYVYMDVKDLNSITEEEKEQGLFEMRRKAGIAMEYLEKWQEYEETGGARGTDEGSFLQDWEVIYAADNYKAIADYLDYKWTLYSKKMGVSLDPRDFYPDRETVEKLEKAHKRLENYQAAIKLVLHVADKVISVYGKVSDAKSAQALADMQLQGKISFKDTGSKILEGVINKQRDRIIDDKEKEIIGDDIFLACGFALLYNIGDLQGFLSDTLEYGEDIIIEKLAEHMGEIREEIIELNRGNSELELQLTEELDMRDTGFRVLVLKKEIDGEDHIVITYKGKEADKKYILPGELDLIQMVYSKILLENPDARIYLTGYQGGADFAFINGFISGDKIEGIKLFYKNTGKLKEYINYTREDIDKEYKTLKKCIMTDSKGTLISSVEKLIITTIGTAVKTLLSDESVKFFASLKGYLKINIKMILITFAISILNSVLKYIENMLDIESIYEELITLNIIKKEENGVEGYITDEFMDNDYITINLIDGELKIKKEHWIYLSLVRRFQFNSGYIVEFPLQDKEDLIMSDSMSNVGMGIQREDLVHPYGKNGTWYLKKDEKDGIYKIYQGILTREIPKTQKGPFRATPSLIEDYKYEEYKSYNPFLKEERLWKELNPGFMLTNLLETIGMIQRSYINRKKEMYEIIYPADTADKLIVSQELPESAEAPEWINLYTGFNEHSFLAFIDKGTGNICEEIRDDYIKSVFKNLLLKKMVSLPDANLLNDNFEDIKYRNNIRPENRGIISINNNEIGIDNYSQFVKEGETGEYEDIIKEFFKEYLNEYLLGEHMTFVLGSCFNEAIKKRLKEKFEKGTLDDYYEIELNKNRFDLPMIIIGSENELEYKYNPDDFIIGGTLVIQDYSYLNLLKKGNKRKEEKTDASYKELLAMKQLATEREEKQIDKMLKKIGYDPDRLKTVKEYTVKVPGIKTGEDDELFNIILGKIREENRERKESKDILKSLLMDYYKVGSEEVE